MRQPIPGLPGFLYETEASLTNFYRVVGAGGLRIDLHPRAFYPIPVAGLFTVTPFAGGRLTYYNQHVVGTFVTNSGVTVEETIYDPHVRRQVEGGVETETRASRVFDMNGWGGLSALQHVIEPRVTYLMIRGFDQKANPQYDPAIDRHRPRHADHLLAHQSGQRQDGGAHGCRGGALGGGAPRARADLRHRQAISHRQPFKDLHGELIFDPNAILRFRADAAYNVYGLGIRKANADLTARYRDVAVTVGSRFNEIAGANWVVGEVTARILANLDVHGPPPGTSRRERSWRAGWASSGAFSAGPSWPSTCTARQRREPSSGSPSASWASASSAPRRGRVGQ